MKKVNAIKLCYLLIWSLLDICSTIEESCFTSVTMILHNLLTNFDFKSVIFRIFVATILLCAFIYFLVCLQLHGENGIITEQYSDISFIASRLLDNSPSSDWNNRTIGRSVILEVFRRYW